MWSRTTRSKVALSVVLVVALTLVAHGIFPHFGSSKPIWVPGPGVALVPPPKDLPVSADSKFTDEELRSNEQVQLMKAKADQVLAGLKKAYSDYNLNFGGMETFEPKSGRTTYTSYDMPKIELDSEDHEFQFRKQSNLLFSYSSNYFFHVVIGKDAPLADKAFQPKWSVDQAIKVGTALLHVLMDDPNVILSAPAAKYDGQRFVEGPKFRAGEWTVSWSRMDGKGHTYASNGVRLEISEDWGVTNAVFWLGDSYVEEKGQLMSADVAISIAKHSHPAMITSSSDIKDYTVKSSQLMIVEPYNIGGHPCRLAWVIWLQPVRNWTPSPDHFIGYDDSQEVTVDALTGQIIGGDAML